ncbi:MAG: hypothetical protein ABIP19_07760 [Dermatophilaceae bacterium]
MASNTDAESSAAHIAELVRRTTERRAAPAPSPVARLDLTVAHQTPAPDPTVAHQTPPPDPTVAHQTPPPDPTVAQPVVAPISRPAAPPDVPPAHRTMQQPLKRILLAAGAIVVLVGGGAALSNTFGPEVGSPPSQTLKTTAPDGYATKVTDVITDCAGHARGRAQASFKTENCVKAMRLLATGQVGGRPVLFVASRIQMPSPEAAASVKQVLDGSGTGNLNDLLREGKTFAGAPAKMPVSGYASVQSGAVVTVAEAGFVDKGRSSNTDPALRAAASQVAANLSAQT